MDNYIQITVSLRNNQQSEILIALLSDIGFEGFEETEAALLGYVPEKKYNPADTELILSRFSLPFSAKNIEQKNWNEAWEKSFESVSVGEFCAIRAVFHNPIKNVEHEVIITPKMSFGTGHHATTYLMIEAMKNIDFKNKYVLDFGTGTGILAILAEKLGAKEIMAVDNDPLCIDNSKENILANECVSVIVVEKATVPAMDAPFDIILANLNRNIILAHLPIFRQQLAPGGVLLVSGLLNEDFEIIRKDAQNYNLEIISKSLKNNWICLKFGENTFESSNKTNENS